MSSNRPTPYRLLLLGALAGLLFVTAGIATARPTDRDRVDSGTFTSGGLTYSFSAFVPAELRKDPPLLVMIHGCRTTAEQQRRANLLDPIARREGFVVLYVDGSALNALQGQCWSGVATPGNESRTSGDVAAIAGMTRLVADRYHVDSRRVYALGMSSGAYETALLGGYFPDLYAALGLHSGAAFGRGGVGCVGVHLPVVASETLAAQAFEAQGPIRRPIPVISFHGDADPVVRYECGQQAVDQWRMTNNMVLAAQGSAEQIPADPTGSWDGVVATPGGHSFSVRSWKLASSACAVQQDWTVHGGEHYWFGGSIAPADAEFTDPRGPNASELAWEFLSGFERTDQGFGCRAHA